MQDEGVTMIDASQLESNLISQSQNPNNMMNFLGQPMSQPPPAQPFDPAIVSFQSKSPGGQEF